MVECKMIVTVQQIFVGLIFWI